MDRVEEIREKYQHELVIDDAPHYWIEFDKDDLVWLLSTIDTLQEQLAEEHAIANNFKDRMLIAETALAEREKECEGLKEILQDYNHSDLCKIGAEIANKGTSARIYEIEGLDARVISDAGREIAALTAKLEEKV